MLEISSFPTLVQLKDFLGGIQHCVTVVGKWIFDSNVPFARPLTRNKLEYCCTNCDETKVMNGYRGVLKSIRFFQQRKIRVLFRSKIHKLCLVL